MFFFSNIFLYFKNKQLIILMKRKRKKKQNKIKNIFFSLFIVIVSSAINFNFTLSSTWKNLLCIWGKAKASAKNRFFFSSVNLPALMCNNAGRWAQVDADFDVVVVRHRWRGRRRKRRCRCRRKRHSRRVENFVQLEGSLKRLNTINCRA